MRRFSKRCCVGLFLLALAGCKSGDTTSPATSSTPPSATPVAAAATSPPASASPASISSIDPCTLLTSDDLRAVQGEELKQANRSDQQVPDYIITQCYYLLPTAVNSVVVNLTMQKPGGKPIRDMWKKMFEESGENEREEKGAKPAKPDKIAGLGQESYWLASQVGGALYVLKKDTILRISLGGRADLNTKLARSKTLAEKALAKIK